jgi:AbrB family looped-hinge helix DNA binding protein
MERSIWLFTINISEKETYMPAKKKVDGKKLIKMVESGKLQSQIMKDFKFNTAAQLKAHYLDALMQAGKAPEIKSGRGKSKAAPKKEVVVSKRGSVVIPKTMIEAMGYAEGSKFAVRKTKAGISLRTLE